MSATPQSSREEIREYQRTLQRAGRYLGAIDGLWGPGTQRAHDAMIASYKAATPAVEQTTEGSQNALDTIRVAIIRAAEEFLNLTETSPNARWDNLATKGVDVEGGRLCDLLIATGWQPGWAYCMAFVEVCWRQAYAGRPELPLITRAMTPSVMGTFENFERLHRIEKIPKPGAVMLMQSGNSWQGHAGIVKAVEGSTLVTIEGNTSSAVASREGDGVYLKRKPLTLERKNRGLWLRGFVNPFLI